MNWIRISLLFVLAGLLAACGALSGAPARIHPLAVRDAAGRAYFVTEERSLGADANFAVLKFWRAAAGEHAPLFQLTLDDWCGNPIAWQLVDDGIVVPAAPATARIDPENPGKCEAQPGRAYVLRDGQFVLVQR